ncbi:hypothetical protein FHS61_000118 [Altererythrobacter atlanticus]|uniref:Uncharacterized protein n=1 Tax=Croceibacterium atlanticum TaxID=1267766 RepID=A0A0F7KP95_9SPHN|nr:hypothetical protein [Croceibacterium atlanticum]AKH42348.1 hypothetical protein WYH_01305 [Croceibacterium atlanticum]MBB5731125.1 hypothetical protein [Croceibacterium atlanticum]
MTVYSQFASKAFAIVGAFAITATLLVSSFATAPQFQAVVGVVA